MAVDAKNGSGASLLLALAALVALLALYRRLWIWLLIALGVLAAGVVAFIVSLDRHYKKKGVGRPAEASGVSPQTYPNVMRHFYNIHDPQMKTLLREIETERLKMLKTVSDDPRDRPAAERFLRTALTGACRIAEGYARLEKAPPGSHEAEATMAKARDSMRSIAQAFAQQNIRLFENDILHLDVETEVLDKTLRAQGYRPEPPAAASETGKESDHERESEP
jgi:hypothetical protein